MVIQLRDLSDSFVEMIKSQTGQATASKAFLHAAEWYETDQTELRNLRGKVEDMQVEIERLKQVIDGARSAAAVLLEHTAQGDLLSRT